MTNESAQYILLTRDCAERAWKRFVDLDKPSVASGMLEAWNKEQFLEDLLDKWKLSFLAVRANSIIGYRVVSGLGKIDGYAHTHRTSVAPDERLRNVGRFLLQQATESAKSLGYQGLTGLRHPDNQASLMFLKSTGWHFSEKYVRGNELWILDF